MAEVPKLLYIVVVDDRGKKERNDTFRYTRSMLQSTLQLMGCKARHAFKISKGVFEALKSKCLGNVLAHSPTGDLGLNALEEESQRENSHLTCGCLAKEEACNHLVSMQGERTDSEPFDLYKRRTTTVVKRERFLDVVCDVLAEYKYVGPNQRADVALACRIREKKESVTVLLCGTSGCGKSTLSSLLGSRLGITTVISTDSIRHMMRSFVDEKQNPLLWASTYHAGEFLDPVAVAQAKAKRRAKKLAHVSHKQPKDEASAESVNRRPDSRPADSGSSTSELISPKQMAIEGFKAQSEMVIDSLDRLITGWEERKESVVVEGVHLSLNFVMGLMKKHPSIIPFMIYIANEEKHLERFAVRAKYMTLDPEKNKYVKYIRNIRKIQDYLCNRADKHLVPKINNTNVDRSVATIHATVYSCLRRREGGDQLYDPTTNMVSVIDEEYRKQNAANSLSSKGMYQLIQRKGSSRHLMALLNTDGSVAKAWPVNSIDENGKPIFYQGNEKGIGGPMYGPLQIGKAEPVNLQFGNFGISAWPSDTCGTSHAGSLDESRADGTETGSKNYSSCCSSPRMSDGPAKELKEEQSVYGSDDEEADEPSEVGSDEDLSDVDERQRHEESEGSVDEESTKSDEEYDDLAMLDGQEYDYWHESEEFKAKIVPVSCDLDTNSVENLEGDKYKKNLDLFLRRNNERVSKPLNLPSVPIMEKNQKKMQAVDKIRRIKRRSLSIPAFKKQESLIQGPIYSGTPET